MFKGLVAVCASKVCANPHDSNTATAIITCASLRLHNAAPRAIEIFPMLASLASDLVIHLCCLHRARESPWEQTSGGTARGRVFAQDTFIHRIPIVLAETEGGLTTESHAPAALRARIELLAASPAG